MIGFFPVRSDREHKIFSMLGSGKSREYGASVVRKKSLKAIADHRLICPIGYGSYGEVWLAQNNITASFRAIKFIWREGFEPTRASDREFEAIKHFEPISRKCEGLVPILHVGELDQGFYYIMELITEISDPPMVSPQKKRVNHGRTDLRAEGRSVSGSMNGVRLSIALDHPIETIAVAPDESLLAIGTKDDSLMPHAVVFFDSTGHRTGISLPHSDGVTFVVFNSQGNRIATCGEDFTSRIWNPFTGAAVTAAMKHKHQVRWAAFNATDEWLATASWDKTVVIWDAETGDPLTPPFQLNDILEFVAFTSEDNEIVAANSKRKFTLNLPFYSGPPGELDSLLPAGVNQD